MCAFVHNSERSKTFKKRLFNIIYKDHGPVTRLDIHSIYRHGLFPLLIKTATPLPPCELLPKADSCGDGAIWILYCFDSSVICAQPLIKYAEFEAAKAKNFHICITFPCNLTGQQNSSLYHGGICIIWDTHLQNQHMVLIIPGARSAKYQS